MFAQNTCVRGACEEILKHWAWSKEYSDRFKAKMANGNHEKALEDFSSHYQALAFKIRAVEVRASAEPYMISEYKP